MPGTPNAAKIKRRLQIITVILALLPLLAFGVWLYHSTRSTQTSNTTQAIVAPELDLNAIRGKREGNNPEILNLDFEDGLSGWNTTGDARALSASEFAKNGTHLLRLSPIKKDEHAVLSQRIPATWNQRIHLTAWVRTRSAGLSDTTHASINIVGIAIDPYRILGSTSQKLSGEQPWTYLEIDTAIPPKQRWQDLDHVEIQLIVESNYEFGQPVAFFDGLTLQIGSRKANTPYIDQPTPKPSEPKQAPSPQDTTQNKPDETIEPSKNDLEDPSIGFPISPPQENVPPEPEPRIPEGMSELELRIFDFNYDELLPGEYTLYIDDQPAQPLKGTRTYQFKAGREVSFRIEAADHQNWEATYPVPAGDSAKHELILSPVSRF